MTSSCVCALLFGSPQLGGNEKLQITHYRPLYLSIVTLCPFPTSRASRRRARAARPFFRELFRATAQHGQGQKGRGWTTSPFVDNFPLPHSIFDIAATPSLRTRRCAHLRPAVICACEGFEKESSANAAELAERSDRLEVAKTGITSTSMRTDDGELPPAARLSVRVVLASFFLFLFQPAHATTPCLGAHNAGAKYSSPHGRGQKRACAASTHASERGARATLFSTTPGGLRQARSCRRLTEWWSEKGTTRLSPVQGLSEQQAWEKRQQEAKEAGTAAATGSWCVPASPPAPFRQERPAHSLVGLRTVRQGQTFRPLSAL